MVGLWQIVICGVKTLRIFFWDSYRYTYHLGEICLTYWLWGDIQSKKKAPCAHCTLSNYLLLKPSWKAFFFPNWLQIRCKLQRNHRYWFLAYLKQKSRNCRLIFQYSMACPRFQFPKRQQISPFCPLLISPPNPAFLIRCFTFSLLVGYVNFPETASSHLRIDGKPRRRITSLLGWKICSGAFALSFRDGTWRIIPGPVYVVRITPHV